MRETHLNSTPNNPLFICDKLHGDRSIAEFAKEFVFGHHLKRHYKSVAQGTIVAARRNLAKHVPLSHQDGGQPGTLTQTSAVPGPKGDLHDPFPFTANWVPKTQRGKRAFAEAVAGVQPPEKKLFNKTE